MDNKSIEIILSSAILDIAALQANLQYFQNQVEFYKKQVNILRLEITKLKENN